MSLVNSFRFTCIVCAQDQTTFSISYPLYLSSLCIFQSFLNWLLKVFSLSVLTITVEYIYYLYSLPVTLFNSTPHLDKKPLFLNLDLRPIATLHLKSDSWDSTEGALVSQKKLPEWLLWWMKYFFFKLFNTRSWFRKNPI